MISLYDFLKTIFLRRIPLCVSPPLVGAVLAISFLLQPLEVHAEEVSFVPEVYEYPGYDSVVYNPIHSETKYIGTVPFSFSTFSIPCSVSFFNGYGGDYTAISGSNYIKIKLVTVYTTNQNFEAYGATVSNFRCMDGYGNTVNLTVTSVDTSISNGIVDCTLNISVNGTNFPFFVGSFLTISCDFNVYGASSVSGNGTPFLTAHTWLYNKATWKYTTYRPTSELSNIESAVRDGNSQDLQFRNEDRQDATQTGSDLTSFSGQLDNVKNKWTILWYPIEFTNAIFGAFQGTQSASYSAVYGNVTGYTYDDELGLLVPVYSKTRDAPQTQGTVITFPEYTLPVLNVKLWDSFSYDISDVTEQIPIVFDLIYVAIGILETYWFVGFLRAKFEEVFG